MWAANEPAAGKLSGAYLQYSESDGASVLFAMNDHDKSNTDLILVCDGKSWFLGTRLTFLLRTL